MSIEKGYSTLAELKDYSQGLDQNTSAVDDGILEKLVESASRSIDRFTGRTFYARTETRKFDTPTRGLTLWVDDDLLTITTLTNGDGTTIDSGDRVFLPANVTPKYAIELIGTTGISWQQSTTTNTSTQAISVLGTWGYSSSTPDDVRVACWILTNDMVQKRFGQGGEDSGSVTPDGTRIMPAAFPGRVRDLLHSYKRLT